MSNIIENFGKSVVPLLTIFLVILVVTLFIIQVKQSGLISDSKTEESIEQIEEGQKRSFNWLLFGFDIVGLIGLIFLFSYIWKQHKGAKNQT